MEFYHSSKIEYTPDEAYWGAPTSTLNFCEEDYEHTRYIAELFNTLTNLTYIILALHGLHGTTFHTNSLGPKLPYIALFNLGVASSLFHSTLKYPAQLCDEFSMLIATFIVFYRLLCFSQARFSPTQLLAMSIGTMAVVVWAQWYTGESTVQQIVFTGMVYWLWRTCFGIIGRLPQDKEEIRKRMWWMAFSGIALFVTGHICWMTDFYACDSLRAWRARLGMPFAAFLELHGSWHILTGVGVYIFMVLVECLRYTQPFTGAEGSDRAILLTNGRWPLLVRLGSALVQGEKKEA